MKTSGIAVEICFKAETGRVFVQPPTIMDFQAEIYTGKVRNLRVFGGYLTKAAENIKKREGILLLILVGAINRLRMRQKQIFLLLTKIYLLINIARIANAIQVTL